MSLPPVPDFKVHVYEAGWRVPSWKPWLLSAISFWQSWHVLFTESAGQRHLPLPPSASRVHATCMFVHVAYGEVLVYPGTLAISVYNNRHCAAKASVININVFLFVVIAIWSNFNNSRLCCQHLSFCCTFFFFSSFVCVRVRARRCVLSEVSTAVLTT